MLNLSIKINSVRRENVTLGDLAVAAHDEHRSIIHLAKKEPRHVGISYVGMRPLSRENIEIVDLQEISKSSISKRNNSHLVRHRREVSRDFTLPIGNASITDVTSVDQNGTRKPLFYKHRFKGEIGTEISDLNSIVLRDRHMEAVPREGNWEALITLTDPATVPATYSLDVFHSFRPTYNTRTYAYSVHYVEYTDSSGNRRLELLESRPAYSKARIEQGFDFFQRLYTVQEEGDGYRYTIIRLRDDNGRLLTGPWYVKPEASSQIKVHRPVVAPPRKQWSLKINNSKIFAYDTAAEMFKKYHIPEYHYQSFMPIEPRKFAPSLECFVLSRHLVVLPFKNLLIDGINIVDILVTDIDLNPKFGFTTSKESESRYWTERLDQYSPEHLGINFKLQKASDRGLSFNSGEGICHIPAPLSVDDRVFVRGFYEEEEFEFTSLNLNPTQNALIADSKVYIYVIPDKGENSIEEQQVALDHPEWQDMPLNAVHYFIVNRAGEIVSWSDFRLSKDIYGSYKDRDNLINAIFVEKDELAAFKSLRPEVLILSSVSVRRDQRVNDIAFIDIREQGGSLTEEVEENLPGLIDEGEVKKPELLWASRNSASGRPIPIQGLSVVRVPCEILSDFGGSFSREEVEERVGRHYALGSAPLIEYYGESPELIRVNCEFHEDLEAGVAEDRVLSAAGIKGLSVEFVPPRKKMIQSGYFDSDKIECQPLSSSQYNFYIAKKLPLRDIDEHEQVNWRLIEHSSVDLARPDKNSGTLRAIINMADIFEPSVPIDVLFLRIVPIVNGNEWPILKPFKLFFSEKRPSANDPAVENIYLAKIQSVSKPLTSRIEAPRNISLNLMARIE